MYRIVDGVKTPYNVLSAREALELSLNDAEREEFCEIIDGIRERALNKLIGYTWYYDPKNRSWDRSNDMNEDNILALLKYYGYIISPGDRRTEKGLYVYYISWDRWKE